MTLQQQEAAPARQEALTNIEKLLAFARGKGLIGVEDLAYARNALLALFRFTEPSEAPIAKVLGWLAEGQGAIQLTSGTS